MSIGSVGSVSQYRLEKETRIMARVVTYECCLCTDRERTEGTHIFIQSWRAMQCNKFMVLLPCDLPAPNLLRLRHLRLPHPVHSWEADDDLAPVELLDEYRSIYSLDESDLVVPAR
jgi:hypothetical protein